MLRRLVASATFKGWILGLATALACALVIGACALFGGFYDTSANTQHSKIAAWAIHETMIHSVQRHASDLTNLPTTASFWSGAQNYGTNCIACHGGPGVDRAPWVRGMIPTPPFLIDAPSRWSRQQLYYIVHDGVKMTGMPAWSVVESDQQVSDVVAFLQVMPKLTPEQFQQTMAKARAAAPDHRAK